MSDDVPLRLQIAEVERELAMRRNVYPRFVSSGKMRKGEADEHTRRMQAVLETLRGLERMYAAVGKAGS